MLINLESLKWMDKNKVNQSRQRVTYALKK